MAYIDDVCLRRFLMGQCYNKRLPLFIVQDLTICYHCQWHCHGCRKSQTDHEGVEAMKDEIDFDFNRPFSETLDMILRHHDDDRGH
jgi:hypothetical protein